MDNISVNPLSNLKRDIVLRGHSNADADELLQLPILLIPGPITPQDFDIPTQKLTNHIAFLSKDLQRAGIPNKIVLRTDVPRGYVEERHAHVDLGTIVMSVMTIQQLSTFANVAQILDFLLNLIQLKFGAKRTAELMPNIKFDFVMQDGERSAQIQVEGAADSIAKILSPSRIKAMGEALQAASKHE